MPGGKYDDLDLNAAVQAHAMSTMAGVQSISPGDAATGIKAANPMGVPPIVAAGSPDQAKTITRNAEQNQVFQSNPNVASFVTNADPAHVAALQDTLPQTAKIDYAADAWKGYDGVWGSFQHAWGAVGREWGALNTGTPAFQQTPEQWGHFALGTGKALLDTLSASAAPLVDVGARSFASVPLPMYQPGQIPGMPGVREENAQERLHSSYVAMQRIMFGLGRHVEAPESGTLRAWETPTPEPLALPPPGAHAGADGLRLALANGSAEAVRGLQAAVADHPMFDKAPEAVGAVVDHLVGDRIVEVDPQKVLDLRAQGHDVLPQFADDAQRAAEVGAQLQVPMSHYIMDSAGKPWADELNAATNFHTDGISLEDAKDIEDAKPKEEAPEETALRLKEQYDALDETTHTAQEAVGEGPLSDALGSTSELSREVVNPEATPTALEEKVQSTLNSLDGVTEAPRSGELVRYGDEHEGTPAATTGQAEANAAAGALGRGDLAGARIHLQNLLGALQSGTFQQPAPQVAPNAMEVAQGTATPGGPAPIILPPPPHSEPLLSNDESNRAQAIAQAYVAKTDELLRPWVLSQLFQDNKVLGMTKTEFNAHAAGIEDIVRTARERATRAAVRQVVEERKPAFQATVAEHYERHLAENEALPNVQAMRSLTQPGYKLNTDYVQHFYPRNAPKLPTTMLHKNGNHPDVAADLLREEGKANYPDGATMVANMADLQEAIKASGKGNLTNYIRWQAKQHAIASAATQHGFDLSPESLLEAAQDFIPQDKIKKFITAELQAIIHQMGVRPDKRLGLYDILRRAGQRFDALPVKEVKGAEGLMRIEKQKNRAGLKAFHAQQRGDLTKAFYWRQIQIARQHDLENAINFQKEYKKATRTFERYRTQKSIKDFDQDHLDILHGLLSEHGMKVPQGNLKYNYQEFVRDMELQMRPVQPYVPIAGVHPDNMTVGDFTIFAARVDNLVHLGKEAGFIESEGKRLDLAHSVSRAVGNAAAVPRRQLDLRVVKRGTVKDWYDRNDAWNFHVETMIDTLDNGDPNGEFNKRLMRPARRAGSENALVIADEMENLTKLMGKMSPELQGYMDTKIAKGHALMDPLNPAKEQVFYGRDVVGMALYAESELGRWHLEEGGNGYSPEAIDNALEQMHPEAKQLVKEIHAIMERIWPKIVEGERSITGVAPEKAQGKYFPLRRDEGLHSQLTGGFKTDTIDLGRHFMSETATPKGHTIARTGAAYPLDLDWQSTVKMHLPSVAKRIAYGNYIQDAQKFLGHKDIVKLINEVHGPNAMGQFKNWLARQVGFYPIDPRAVGIINSAARGLRLRTYGVLTGLKLVIAVEHITAIAQTASVAGIETAIKAYPNAIVRGMLHFLGNPNETTKFIEENSPYMRARHDATAREMIDVLRDISAGKGLFKKVPGVRVADAAIREFTARMFNWINHNMVAKPIWMQAYNDAIKGQARLLGKRLEAMDHEDAVVFADKVIGKSHGSGLELDMGAAQSGGPNEVAKLFNMFNVFRGSIGHITREGAWHLFNDKTAQGKLNGLMQMIMAAFIAIAFAKIVTDQGPSDWSNPQQVGLWALLTALEGFAYMYWMGPFVVGVGTAILLHKPIDANMSPAIPALTKAAKGGANILTWMRHQAGDKGARYYDRKHLIEDQAAFWGMLLGGAPTMQPAETAQSWEDIQRRQSEGLQPKRPIPSLLFGPSHEQGPRPIRIP